MNPAITDGDVDDCGTMHHLFLASLAVFLGSVVEAILGFGCSLIWMSFFPLFTSVQDSVGVLQPMHITLNVFILSSVYKRCTPSELKPLVVYVPFGVLFGLWIVTSWSSNAVDFLLGVFLIVYTMLKNDADDPGHEHADREEKYTDSDSDWHSDCDHEHGIDGGNVVKKETTHLKRKPSQLELKPVVDESDFPPEKQHKCIDQNGGAGTGSTAANSEGTEGETGGTKETDDVSKNDSNASSPSIPAAPISANMPTSDELVSPLTHRHNHSVENNKNSGSGGTDGGIHNNAANSISQKKQSSKQETRRMAGENKTTTTTTINRRTTKLKRKKQQLKNNSNLCKMIRNPTAVCAGFIGGALMGAFGTGGPAFLVYAKEAGWQSRPEVFRANMQLLFFVINIPVAMSQSIEGIVTYHRFRASIYLLPALVLGGHIGGLLATKVPRDKFQLLVVNGLRIMGIMFLFEALR